MLLKSYKNLLSNILDSFEESTDLFIINAFVFKQTISLMRGFNHELQIVSFSYLDLNNTIPNFLNEFRNVVNNQNYYSLTIDQTFLFEMIATHEYSWIERCSKNFKEILTHEANSQMKDWQRFVRADISNNKSELVYLALDPSEKVRERALEKLKEF